MKKNRNWMDFGIPGEVIGEALGGILDQKKGNKKKHEKKQVKAVASAGHADPGKEGLEGQTSKVQHAPGPPCGMGGRIEPAEPEPPPAHSLGRVGEDDMGRSGKLARPCWLGAGGEALVVRNWWRGWWLALPRLFFFDQVCDQLCTVLSTFLVDFVSKTGPKRAKKPKEIEKTFF